MASERERVRLLARRVAQQFKDKQVQARRKNGTATLTVALGTTVTVPIVWDAPMPDADYLCWAVLTTTTGLASIRPLSIAAQTKDGCTVLVTANVALGAACTFTAFGVKVP